MEIPQQIKNRTNHMIQQTHFWVFIQRKQNHYLKKKSAPSSSLHYYLY